MKRILIIVAISIVVLLSAGWWYVFHTNAGINFLLARVGSLKSMHIEAQGVEGSLAGPLRIKHILVDHKTVRVEADDVLLELTPFSLLFGTLQVDSAAIGRADVNVKQTNEESNTAPKFFPSFLRLVVNNADVHAAHVVVYDSFVQNAERAQGNVRLTAGRLRVSDAKIDASPYHVSGEIAVFARRPVELEIAAHLITPAPRGSPFDVTLALKGPVSKFHLDVELQTPSKAQFHGDFTRDANRWQLAGNADSQRFAFDPWIEHPPFALQDFSAKIEAAPDGIHIAGGVTVPEVDALPLQLDFRGQYAARVIAITHGELRPSKSDMTLVTAARIDLSAGRPVIAATAQWTNLRWPLRADYFVSPQGQVSLFGSLPFALGVNAEVNTQREIGGHLLAHGELSSEAIDFDEMTLDVLDGEIKGAARLGFGVKREWQASVTGRNINPRPFNEQIPGSVDFKVDAKGAGLDRKADFAITLPNLQGTLRNEPLDGHGYVSHDAGGWNAKELSLSLGANRLTANGEWRQRIDLAWSLEVPALDKFIHDAKGSIRFSGTAHGSQSRPQIAGLLVASKLNYGAWNVEDISLAGNVDLSDQLASELRLDAAKLGWGDNYLDTLRVRAQGKASGHQIELRGVTTKNGAFSKISTKVEGNYLKDIWQARIAPVEFADGTGAAPTVEASEGRLFWSANHRALTDLCLLWTTHKLCANGDWVPQGAWSVNASSDALPLNVFDGTFPQRSKYQGSWQVQAKFSGSATTPWTGQAIVDVNNASLAYQAIAGADELVRLGSGRVSVTVANDRYTGDVRIVTPGTTNIEASARIDRSTAEFGSSPLGGELRASTSDANLLPLFFPDLDHSAGDLKMQLRVAGTPSAPLLQGQIDLKNGELDLYRYNLSMRELGVGVRIVDNQFSFDGQAKMGTGQFAMNGDLAWRDSHPIGKLHLQGENLLVANLLDYKVTASPNVDFKVDGRRVDVTGEVVIPSAHIEPRDLRGAVQASRDARLVGELPEAPTSGFDVHSEVRVRIGQDVHLDTYGLQGKLGGSVVINTDGQSSTGQGELNVTDGRYETYGQKLDIARGRLLFEASPLGDPGLDIQASRKIEDTRVGVNVRGTLRSPRVTLFSEPGLPQAQIVSMLLTGKPIADLSSKDAAAVSAAQSDLRLQGGSVLASQLGRRLGLEDVSFESNGLNDTSLVLGKFLSPKIFVSYGISLTESINTLKLRYTITDKWRLKTEAGQNQSADIEYRIER